ncbi:60S ribosomal protein L13 isoform 1 [Tropilaelaps mercedesae]|uniref:Large ribosomal subunit protein eL13 n=1 Tax=Tropilaelaps mercedesae TaxID=418985 RepID=A0A1V9XD20_9ACAR|nr:60S ribosomal protein L13 isoform 1 [Tropilaelaps mercedesae]
MARGGKVIPNNHFRKHWQRRVKTWFDQTQRHKRRAANRVIKARKIAPRPTSVEALQRNVARLKNYRAKLILFPKRAGKPLKGDSTEKEIQLAQQLQGVVMPVKRSVISTEAPRVVTQEEKDFRAYNALRFARHSKRVAGPRAKKAKDEADALEAKK